MKLFPSIPAEELIGPVSPPQHPETRAIAITTLSGASATGGNTHNLGNDTDSQLLQGLRAWADCVLVGARTVRKEGYGPSATPLAIPTRSLDFDTTAPLFTGSTRGPLLLCTSETLHDDTLAPTRSALKDAGAEFVDTGSGSATEMVAALRNLGFQRIAVEGGPGIYSLMFQADLVDVFHLTIEPTAHGPVEKHLFSHRPGLEGFSHRMRLEDARATNDSLLFLRYRRVR